VQALKLKDLVPQDVDGWKSSYVTTSDVSKNLGEKKRYCTYQVVQDFSTEHPNKNALYIYQNVMRDQPQQILAS